MVWLAIWSSIAFEPQCLTCIRWTVCYNGTVIEDCYGWVDKNQKTAMFYTKNITNLPLEVFLRRRRVDTKLSVNVLRFYAAIKLRDKIRKDVEQLNNLIGWSDRFSLGDEDIRGMENELGFFETILGMGWVDVYRTPVFMTTYDARRIRGILEPDIHIIRAKVIRYNDELIYETRSFHLYPIRYIKAIIKCIKVSIKQPSYINVLEYLRDNPQLARLIFNCYKQNSTL